MNKELPDLGSRLALRPKEAADALGIGERTLRQILPELPHVRVGGVVLLPVEALRRWLLEQSLVRPSIRDKAVQEILDGLQDT